MKVRALAGFSGPMGHKVSGDEFEVTNEVGAELVERRLVEAVEPDAKAAKPTKPKPDAGE